MMDTQTNAPTRTTSPASVSVGENIQEEIVPIRHEDGSSISTIHSHSSAYATAVSSPEEIIEVIKL